MNLLQAPWYVAHSRPRAEKKIAQFCAEEGWIHSLPLYQSVKNYRGKRLVFKKPLFPGYVFVRLEQNDVARARQHRHVANLLSPPDQTEFVEQLDGILAALETDREVRIAPHIVEGNRVKIAAGPLRGIEGFVLHRPGIIEVILRLDFIGHGAAVKVSADELELI